MRSALVVTLVLLGPLFRCFSQDSGIDADRHFSKGSQRVTGGSGRGVYGGGSGGTRLSHPAMWGLSVSGIEQVAGRDGTSYRFVAKLRNVSAETLSVPVGESEDEVIDHCSQTAISVGLLLNAKLPGGKTEPLVTGVDYEGCVGLPGSLVAVAPDHFITFTGTAHLQDDARVAESLYGSVLFSEVRYVLGEGPKLLRDSRDLSVIQSEAVSLPK